MKIWPAIDLLEGKCVRLRQGDFSKSTIYSDKPLEVVSWLLEMGAEQIHVVDLSRAQNPEDSQIKWIKQICANSSVFVQVGGGVRTLDQASKLIDVGVKRLVLGSLAVTNPELTSQILNLKAEFVLAVDVKESGNEFYVATQAWSKMTRLTPEFLLAHYPQAKTILCTDIQRDGELLGPNLQLYSRLRKNLPHLEILASGGVESLDNLKDLQAIRVNGVVVGKALYEGRFTLKEALQCLRKG